MKLSIFTFIILFMFSFINYAQYNDSKKKLFPVDESGKDKTFLEFKNKLINAVNKKDIEFILKYIDPKVENSLGGDGGIEEFKEMWDINNPETKLWSELERIIKMGGTFTKNGNELVFIAPYVNSAWPEKLAEEAAFYICVIDSLAFLYEKPSDKSKILEKLSYDILKVTDDEQENQIWRKVKTFKNKTGYVLSKHLRSTSDISIGFAKRNDSWKIIWLMGGE